MEGLVFLLIIGMVVRSLYKNSKEARRKEAERRQGQGEAPAPQPQQKSRTRPSLPGSLPEWIEMLSGESMMERESRPVPAPPPAPAQPLTPQAYVPQGVSTEGCQTFQRDCESPHRALETERWREEREPAQQQGRPLSFLEGMPEVIKGVVYAEILTRPQQRRRLRP